VKFRESFAIALLMFLSEDLSCKFPKLSGQVFVGWKRAFGGPISFEQLVNRPDAKSTMFTDEEEDWFTETIHHFVSEMTAEKLEELGITDCQLDVVRISKPTQPARCKVKTTPFRFYSTSADHPVLTCVCCRRRAAAAKAQGAASPAGTSQARSHPIPFSPWRGRGNADGPRGARTRRAA
jgi:hypothetical protein